MSHYTRCAKAQIISKDAFIEASKELGFSEIRENTKIRSYDGSTHAVNVAAKVPGAQYEIGLVKNDNGKFDMTGDFWGIRHKLPAALSAVRTDEELQNALLQTTTKHYLISHYRKLGFQARVSQKEDRTINIQLTR